MAIKLIEDPNEIKLNNEDEIDYILGHSPSWILRYGQGLLFFIFTVFVLLAWVIRYPDVLPSKVQILTENPAIRLFPKTGGKLKELLVKNQQEVEKGSLIAVIENSTNRLDVYVVEGLIKKIESIEFSKSYLDISFSENLVLGSLQSQYASLIFKIKDYQHYLKQSSIFSKIWNLEDQVYFAKEMIGNLKNQQLTIQKEVELSYKNYLRIKQLNLEKVVSDLELEQNQSAYLQYKRQQQNFETQIINYKVTIEQLKSQIIDLKQNRKDGRSSRELAIIQNAQTLKSMIDDWKQTYTFISPINGKISFGKIWSENQYISVGEELFTIVPIEGTGKVIAKASLPIANSGKVKIGQAAHIYLDGFPYQEYGILKSCVSTISLIPNENHYLIDLEIPDSLITTYGKTIPFAQEMQGIAKIITEDKRIFHRIFDRLWNLAKNN